MTAQLRWWSGIPKGSETQFVLAVKLRNLFETV